jgi:Ras GTPase-activating-like protein IQGAP2/3
MSPTPYRSSYLSIKKASTYGQIGARRLGFHLPTGDGDDAPLQHTHTPPPLDHTSLQKESPLYRVRDLNDTPRSPVSQGHVATGIVDSDDVAGVPGRLRLSRDKAPTAAHASPLPSSRLTRGLWADIQRHLLQAYEYLCQVGEAQQWIEGCLGEELGIGVVDMEEGLWNGVILAKLVRAFQGEHVVRRIYEVFCSPSLFNKSDFPKWVRSLMMPSSSRDKPSTFAHPGIQNGQGR